MYIELYEELEKYNKKFAFFEGSLYTKGVIFIILLIFTIMKNTLKLAFLSTVALHSYSVYAIDVTRSKNTTAGDNGNSTNFVWTLDNILGYVIGLLYFIAVVFALWGGFQILTAGGDEEKVKKGKTTLIQAVIGLIVIFLASSIIRWVVQLGTDSNIIQ